MPVWGPTPRGLVLGLGQAWEPAAWPLPQVTLMREIWAEALTREDVVRVP